MTRCPDSLTACNTLSSSAPPYQNRCAENTDGRNFLHLNSPSVNIDCAYPHTTYTFSVTSLKNIGSSSFKPQSEVGFDSSCFKPQSVVAPQTVQSPTCDNQHHRIFFFISANAADVLAPHPSPDWKSANLLRLRGGEQDLDLRDLVGPCKQSRC